MNLTLESITFRGFRSFYSEYTLGFDKGPLFLFGKNLQHPEKFQSNAAGKSTVALALLWCLTGRLPMKVQKDEVINRQSDEAFVEAKFTDLLIRRSKKRGYAESLYWKTSDGREGKGELGEIARGLTEIIGIDNALIFNSLWIDGESKTVQFLFAQDGERMEILEGLLAQNLFSNARKLASDACTEAKRREATHNTEAVSRQAEYDNESGRYERAVTALAEYDERVTTAEARRDKRRAEIAGQREALKVRYAAHQEQHNDLEDASREVGNLEEDLHAAEQEAANLSASYAVLRRAAGLEMGAACPTCRQPVTKECMKPVIKDLEKYGGDFHRTQKEVEDLRPRLAEARRRLREAEAAGAALKPIRHQAQALKEEDARLDEAVDYGSRDALYAAVAESKKNLLVLEAGILSAKGALVDAKTDVDTWAFWMEGFGSKGLRTIMLDKVRVMMQHHVDLYVKRLAGDAFSVKFPPSKSGFAIVLETAEGPVSVESFSKGEVWRANIAVLLSLRKVLQYMKATPLNFLILDDPCSGSVDDVGADSIVETIIAISEEFDQVFCTLPKEVAVPYDRALMVVKDAEGFSEIRGYTA